MQIKMIKMMKLNRRFAGAVALTTALGALATAGVVAPSVLAQNGAMQTNKMGTTKAGEVSADKNVKNATRGSAKVVQPAKKGGKTRAGIGKLLVDNWTKQTIDIFVDGDYVGDVSPYGEASGYYSSGSHTLYARTTDGDSWGPRTATIGSGTFTWKLTN